MDTAARSYYRSYMASLTKRSTSKYWVACFTDRSGRRLKLSTKTMDRKQALKIAEAYEDAARKKRTSLQVRRVISALHKEITGDDLTQTTVRSHFDQWLARKGPETAASTAKFYEGAAKKFLLFLGPKANSDIAEITRDDILGFRNAEIEQLAPKTVNHLVKVLRMAFRAAKRDGLLADDPAEFVDTVREKSDKIERRPFTMDELQRILSVADEEWTSMILFGLYTGQRLADIAGLTWSNVDLKTAEIRLTARKTGKRMLLPIAAPLLRSIKSLPTPKTGSDPLHSRSYDIITKQGKSGNLSNQFADLLVKAGMREKQPHRATHGKGRGLGSAQNGVSFHCLRHTAVTLLKEAGIPGAVVMELVGHDSKQMSEHYTHVGNEALKKATDAIPDITTKGNPQLSRNSSATTPLS